MNEPRLNEGWPLDPENDDLRQLAEQIRDAAPSLPADALARLDDGLQDELTPAQRRRMWRRVAPGAGLPQSMLSALIGYATWRPATPVPQQADVNPAGVTDRIKVAYAEPG